MPAFVYFSCEHQICNNTIHLIEAASTTMNSFFAGLILQDTLTNVDIVHFIVVDSLCILVILTISKRYMLDTPPKEDITTAKEMEDLKKDKRKKFGWILTLVNSFLLSLLSIIYTYYRFVDNNEFNKEQKFPILYIANNMLQVNRPFSDFTYGRDNLSSIMCIHLAVVNVIDLVYGSIYYPEAIDILSGWIHHIVYTWIVILCTTGNGFIAVSKPFTKCMGTSLMLEIPTFMLALGHIFKSLRSDYGFGFSFLMLRIIFHAYVIICMLLSQTTDIILNTLLLLTFSMHVFWFYSWSKIYVIKPITLVIKSLSQENLKVSLINKNDNNHEREAFKKSI